MMKYKVLDTFPIGQNTSVTIQGNGDGLRNNMEIRDSSGIAHQLITVAMMSKGEKNMTTLLIQGVFDSKDIVV